jgi:RHS repeat-associated protein
VKEAVNEHSTVQFTRNKMGHLTTEEQNGIAVHSSYDALGNRIHVSSSAGADIAMQRTPEGLVGQIKAGSYWQADLQYDLSGLETERVMTGGISSKWRYDCNGRPEAHTVTRDGVQQSWKKYTWTINNRLTTVFDALAQTNTRFKYDTVGNLVFAQYADNSIVHRAFDATGNIYDTAAKTGRKYNSAGALLESKKYYYTYDEEGRLISKTPRQSGKPVNFEWYANGLLKKVIKTDQTIEFKYDPFGRRVEKRVAGAGSEPTITRWAWDDQVMLHEWTYAEKDKPVAVVDEWGQLHYDKPEPLDNIITWVYNDESFTPSARLQNGEAHSIISDHMGTPTAAYDREGTRVWESTLDIYGRAHTLKGDKHFIPFRYQGQYDDAETGLYYNRYRYYNASEGIYISNDPIGLAGGVNVYRYVNSTNTQIDPLGLAVSNANLPRYVYRALNGPQEAQAKAGVDITPKAPNANWPMEMHINYGPQDLHTQYISASTDINAARAYSSPNPAKGKYHQSTIIRIDTWQLDKANYFDCSDGIDPQTGKPFIGNALRWTQEDSEVLIKGGIPAGSYDIVQHRRDIFKPPPGCNK